MSGPAVAGVLVLDLTVERTGVFVDQHERSRIRHRACDIARAPVGGVVIIRSNDPYPEQDVIAFLHEYGSHVGRIIVEHDDPAGLQRWLDALEGVRAA